MANQSFVRNFRNTFGFPPFLVVVARMLPTKGRLKAEKKEAGSIAIYCPVAKMGNQLLGWMVAIKKNSDHGRTVPWIQFEGPVVHSISKHQDTKAWGRAMRGRWLMKIWELDVKWELDTAVVCCSITWWSRYIASIDWIWFMMQNWWQNMAALHWCRMFQGPSAKSHPTAFPEYTKQVPLNPKMDQEPNRWRKHEWHLWVRTSTSIIFWVETPPKKKQIQHVSCSVYNWNRLKPYPPRLIINLFQEQGFKKYDGPTGPFPVARLSFCYVSMEAFWTHRSCWMLQMFAAWLWRVIFSQFGAIANGSCGQEQFELANQLKIFPLTDEQFTEYFAEKPIHVNGKPNYSSNWERHPAIKTSNCNQNPAQTSDEVRWPIITGFTCQSNLYDLRGESC